MTFELDFGIVVHFEFVCATSEGQVHGRRMK